MLQTYDKLFKKSLDYVTKYEDYNKFMRRPKNVSMAWVLNGFSFKCTSP